MNRRSRLLNAALVLLSSLLASATHAFDVPLTQVEVAAVPTIDHRPIRIAVTYADTADRTGLAVNSDAAWAAPTLDETTGEISVVLATGGLINRTNTATITLSRGGTSDQVFIKATVSPMNIVALADDPVRSRTYAVQQDGINAGAVVIIDPVTGTSLGNITVDRKPSDLVVTPDGLELLVICSASQSISIVDLATLRLKPSIALPTYSDWGVADTSADIDLGAGSIIYYTDGAWAPNLHVLDRAAGTVLQTVVNPSSSLGFGDIVVAPDRKSLFGWGQYGWSAGSMNSLATKYSIGADGRLTFVENSTDTYPTGMSRDPLNTPALISLDGEVVITKQKAFSAASLQAPVRAFPGPVYAATPELEIVATSDALYDFVTGNKLYDLPVASTVQVITSDYSRLVYFDTAAKSLKSVDLLEAVGESLLGRSVSPADGSITLPPTRLTWSPVPGIDRYQVYLGTSLEAVTQATTGSAEYKGELTTAFFELPTPLAAGQEYFWRVDPVSAAEVSAGAVRRFTVSVIASSLARINAATVSGHADYRVPVELTSAAAGQAWTATADVSWISFAASAGTTPATLQVVLDASALGPGVHRGSVSVGTGAGSFAIPVTLEIDPLELTHIKSRPGSATVYAISEDTSAAVPRAYLLEIDAAAEKITRVAPAGKSVTDIAIHAAEGRIYVTNWMGGSLLAFDQATLELKRTYAFKPFAGMGYGEDDAYRVSAGGAGRIIVEEQDQWIDISIYDTTSGTKLASTFVREGGGQYAPDLRYYYHGENNSSGANLLKFDTVADVFAQVASVRVEHTSYYGSRVVVVSEDGTRIFWAGGVFRPDLTEEWALKDIIYSASANGRYAFGETKIYDVSTRQAVFGMPADTRVSGFNNTTNKLVVQVGQQVGFFALGESIAMPAPTLSAGTVEATRATLTWTDRSLETGFTLQRRAAGESTWSDVTPALVQNVTTTTVTGLAEETTYEFRIKADSPGASSTWSNVVSITTPVIPPGVPSISWLNPAGATAVDISWWVDGPYESVLVERRGAGTGWTQVASVAYPASGFSDTALQAATTYEYRIRTTRRGLFSSYSPTLSAMTLDLPPIATIVSQPRSMTVFAGQLATLGVTVNGQGPVTYQWFKDGVALAGATMNYLRFYPVTVSNAGTYTVAVTNPGGTVVSLPAVLTVPGTSLTSVYFGTFSGNRGRWALAQISPTQVFFLAYLTDPVGVIAAAVPLDELGHFAGTVGLAIPPTGGSTSTTVSMSLDGQMTNGVATGSFIGTDISFAGVADAANGPTKGVSGLFTAGGIGGAGGMLVTIVGTNGDMIATISSPQRAEGAAGPVDAAGTFALASAAGTQFAGTISPAMSSVSAVIRPAGGSALNYASVLPAALRTDRLVNISSRGTSSSGNDVMIAGFTVGGSTPRRMLIRSAGPALAAFKVADYAGDARLDLYQGDNHLLHNDDWGQTDAAAIATAASQVKAFGFAAGSKDAALLVELAPGSYTAISRSATDTGVLLTEVYDVSSVTDTVNAVRNLSIRARIASAAEPVIAGFVVAGNSPKRVLIRAVGPGLQRFGIPPEQLLADPELSVVQDDAAVVQNDNWVSADASAKSAAAAATGAFPLSAASPEAVVLTTLLPGIYTAVVTGHGGTGIVLVEVYQME